MELLLLLGQRYRRMVVQALGHQLQGERILLAAGLLDLGPLVLEPNLDLRLVQAQLCAQLLAAAFVQVAVLVELPLWMDKVKKKERWKLVSLATLKFPESQEAFVGRSESPWNVWKS